MLYNTMSGCVLVVYVKENKYARFYNPSNHGYSLFHSEFPEICREAPNDFRIKIIDQSKLTAEK